MRALALLAMIVGSTVAQAEERSPDVPKGYALVWADEFNRDGLPDPAKWGFDTHANKTGWYNNELQYYSAKRKQNASIADGRLVITARREKLSKASDYGGQDYSSARLISQDKADWTYGFFEVRAKLPCGGGSWPAIWMLGSEGEWPDGGEIDIMEHVGNEPGVVHSTVHNRATAGTFGDGGSVKVSTACSKFHRYQVEWTESALRFAVDGRPVHRYVKKGKSAAGWPFDKPLYMLLNLAVGGVMGGKVDDRSFPVRFEIDYVRVYQRGK